MKLLYVALITVFLYDNVEGMVYRHRRGPINLDSPHVNASTPVLGTIEMPVDHYNPADPRKFEMRYHSNDQFFQKGGPIFIFLGGDWSIRPGDLMTGQIYDMAETHNGYMFQTEHRYYGESLPTIDWSISNLKYLSADQALEDLAFFIKAKKAEIADLKDSKVIVVGGSYAGNLATWARLKYPHLIDVAYASSAPLKVVTDFFEYYEAVDQILNQASERCVTVIQEPVTAIERLLQNENGTNYVSSLFNTCIPLTNKDPYRSFFFNSIAEVYAYEAETPVYNGLGTACGLMLETEATPIERLAIWTALFYVNECMGGYDEYIEETSSDIPNSNGERLWLYQSCMEFGSFLTTTSDDQPFGKTFPLAFYTQICKDVFGEEFTDSMTNAAVERTNTVYGSNQPAVSYLVSVHGTRDPWHTLGILENNSSDTVVSIYVEGTAHCADLPSVKREDLQQLRAAKLQVQEVISKWISD